MLELPNPINLRRMPSEGVSVQKETSPIPRPAMPARSCRPRNCAARAHADPRNAATDRGARRQSGATDRCRDRVELQARRSRTVNHRSQTEFAIRIAGDVAGGANVHGMPPLMGVEDFAFMLGARPAVHLLRQWRPRWLASPGLQFQRRGDRLRLVIHRHPSHHQVSDSRDLQPQGLPAIAPATPVQHVGGRERQAERIRGENRVGSN